MFAPPAAPPLKSAPILGKRGILCGPSDKYAIRMVTHYDVDRAAIDRARATPPTSEVVAGRETRRLPTH